MPTLDLVCERALALPCSPTLLPRLAKLLEHPGTNVDELVDLVELDTVLASGTLRLANSAFFANRDPVASVGEAVLRLGATELYRLASISLAERWSTIELDGYRWEPGDFFRSSVVTALAAEELARETWAVDSTHAYTCGLVYEIGKLAIAHSCADEFPAIRARRAARGGSWIEAETAVLGFNHATVGSRLLRRWRFPPECVVVAAHNPPDEKLPAEHRPLAAHVHAARHLAAALGAGQGEDAYLYRLDSALLIKEGLEASVLERVMPRVLDRAGLLLGRGLLAGPLRA